MPRLPKKRGHAGQATPSGDKRGRGRGGRSQSLDFRPQTRSTTAVQPLPADFTVPSPGPTQTGTGAIPKEADLTSGNRTFHVDDAMAGASFMAPVPSTSQQQTLNAVQLHQYMESQGLLAFLPIPLSFITDIEQLKRDVFLAYLDLTNLKPIYDRVYRKWCLQQKGAALDTTFLESAAALLNHRDVAEFAEDLSTWADANVRHEAHETFLCGLIALNLMALKRDNDQIRLTLDDDDVSAWQLMLQRLQDANNADSPMVFAALTRGVPTPAEERNKLYIRTDRLPKSHATDETKPKTSQDKHKKEPRRSRTPSRTPTPPRRTPSPPSPGSSPPSSDAEQDDRDDRRRDRGRRRSPPRDPRDRHRHPSPYPQRHAATGSQMSTLPTFDGKIGPAAEKWL